jgi:hypothetical protein
MEFVTVQPVRATGGEFRLLSADCFGRKRGCCPIKARQHVGRFVSDRVEYRGRDSAARRVDDGMHTTAQGLVLHVHKCLQKINLNWNHPGSGFRTSPSYRCAILGRRFRFPDLESSAHYKHRRHQASLEKSWWGSPFLASFCIGHVRTPMVEERTNSYPR